VLDEPLVVLAPAPIVVLVTDACIKILRLNIKLDAAEILTEADTVPKSCCEE